MESATDPRSAVNQRLVEVLALHFDVDRGAPYWIEKAARLSFDPLTEIRSIADLPRMGAMDRQALRDRPLSDFVPRAFWNTHKDLVIVQTGGTLGEPIWTAYTPDEYEAAFVAPFTAAANHVGFPSGGTWLYVGPTGPHVIGRAARSIALATGAGEPFTVDFDSRWAKKLPAGSFAADRYLSHVVEQSLDVIRRQPITHLFTTPPVLAALAGRMSPAERERIIGVHYGGMSISEEAMARFQREHFPRAVHLSGYGNTLFGCCLELDTQAGRTLKYYPHGHRLIFGICREGEKADSIDYTGLNEKGRLAFSRLDETMLLINMIERDEAAIIPPPDSAPKGFSLNGLLAPAPHRSAPGKLAQSLY